MSDVFSSGDPGTYGGIAAVRRVPGKRCILLGVWPIFGADHLWLARAREGCAAARDLGALTMHVENPPVRSRKGTLKGDSGGQVTWRGIGRRKGMIEAMWFVETGIVAQTLEHKTWTSALKPIVGSKKRGKGLHRIREASMLVVGAQEMLAEVRPTCRVDCAEAILMAAAVAKLTR